jgi:hypothetical protein
MLEHTFVRPGVIARLRQSPLGPYVDAFAASLHQEGYAPYNIRPRSWDRPLYARRGGLRGAGGSSTDSKIAANIERGF